MHSHSVVIENPQLMEQIVLLMIDVDIHISVLHIYKYSH